MKKRQIRERGEMWESSLSRESDQRGYALHTETKSLFQCETFVPSLELREGERKDEKEK